MPALPEVDMIRLAFKFDNRDKPDFLHCKIREGGDSDNVYAIVNASGSKDTTQWVTFSYGRGIPTPFALATLHGEKATSIDFFDTDGNQVRDDLTTYGTGNLSSP